MKQLHTAESLREIANEHFEALLARPTTMMRMAPDVASAAIDIARKALEATLALKEGDLLQFSDVLDWNEASSAQRAQLLGALPFFMGTLSLLSMQFAHETAGVIPTGVVRQLLESPEPVMFDTVLLTESNVNVQYRRLPYKEI